MAEESISKTLPQNLSRPSPAPPSSDGRDSLARLEAYLAKRDGVDKLLKISRYASKIILASSLLPQSHPRLKSFESSVGLSRKAFRLGKFVQDVNALRSATHRDSGGRAALAVLAYGGEGVYYFLEQFVWLGKAGLIDGRRLPALQKISAWAELIGYVGSIALKAMDLGEISEEVGRLRCAGGVKEAEKLRLLREKELLKKLSILQDFADGLMAVADVRDAKGPLAGPLLLSSAGLLSALISTHKNWISC
ncbi:hypothetical protein ACLOJK_002871 [Asimina triloba]